MILIIPIAAIWGLHINKRRKIKLSAMFAVGLMWAPPPTLKHLYPCLEFGDDDDTYSASYCKNDADATWYHSGVLASLARLGYQVPEAKKPNQTIIIMILSELKYVTLSLSPEQPQLTPKLTRWPSTALPNTWLALSSPPCPASRHSSSISVATSLPHQFRSNLWVNGVSATK